MHLYDKQGRPVYEVPYADKSKGMRKATLADAKKLDLAPSVTEIIKVLDKPGLNNWKRDQAILAALTLPRDLEETDGSYLRRVVDDSKAQAKMAAEKGVEIHMSIEDVFRGEKPYNECEDIARQVYRTVIDSFNKPEGWVVEKSFFHPAGFGGRVDLHHPDGIVIDIKTKEKLERGKRYAWDEHGMQLAAYAEGLEMPDADLYNLFVDYDGQILFYHWADVSRELDMFKACLMLWQLQKKYFPMGGP